MHAARFRSIFRRAHAAHATCAADEWLMQPCRDSTGDVSPRPLAWSRRNGAWRQVSVLVVGAAPGNAGGRGRGARGAHGTRIPFGGDVAGANLDVLLAACGLDRNHTFIVAALNQLPERGGGEPAYAEIAAPVGDYPSSLHLLRDTMMATGATLIVALGNVALRSVLAAAAISDERAVPRLPSLARIEKAGLRRGVLATWPAAEPPSPAFATGWSTTWPDRPLPLLLLCWHPSAQNMSPFAAPDTVFHRRMLETRDALRAAVLAAGIDEAARPLDAATAVAQAQGIYALPEWRELIAPYHSRLIALWRERGIA